MKQGREASRRKSLCRLTARATLLLLVVTSVAQAEENLNQGPFCVQGQSVFQVLRLTMIPWCEAPLSKGQFQLQTLATWVNSWCWMAGGYLVDGEVLRIRTALSYGLTEWLQLRFEVPATLYTGGILDPAIEGFHEGLDIFNSYREAFPQNRFRVVFYPPGGGEVRLDSRNTGLALGDLILSANARLSAGTRYLPAVLLGMDLKIPTGFNEGGGVDVAGNLFLAKRVWRLYGFGGVQFTHYGKAVILGVPLKSDLWSFILGVEAALTDRFSLLIQQFTDTGQADDFYTFSESAYEIEAGFKYRIAACTRLEFAVIQNLANYDNSPDVGAHFGITHRFQ